MEKDYIILNKERNVTLTAYIQEVGGKFGYIKKRPAVLILPGGGYQYCSKREADPVAFAYLQAGYQVFVLDYSVAEHNAWPNPLEDVEMAMEWIRTKEEWNVYPDKVAVVGFSAGGHLAAAVATMGANRPNAAILGYAVAGEDVKACNPTAPNTIPYVDKNTCPCFLFATRTDEVVRVENSIEFMNALAKANVAFESHIYAYGPHGFSVGNGGVHYRETPLCKRAHHWVEDSIGWLQDMFGEFGDGEMTVPACRTYFTGDNEPYFSVGCTIGHLLANEAARACLGELVSFLERDKESLDVISKMHLRGTLKFIGVPAEKLEEIDRNLRRISSK